jgi:hypothetical protein
MMPTGAGAGMGVDMMLVDSVRCCRFFLVIATVGVWILRILVVMDAAAASVTALLVVCNLVGVDDAILNIMLLLSCGRR